jgi:hypothetical protein
MFVTGLNLASDVLLLEFTQHGDTDCHKSAPVYSTAGVYLLTIVWYTIEMYVNCITRHKIGEVN